MKRTVCRFSLLSNQSRTISCMAGTKLESQTGSRGYLLLNGACCQKAVHVDPLLLPIAPHPRSGLLVICWVPARACRECIKLRQAPLFDTTSQSHTRLTVHTEESVGATARQGSRLMTNSSVWGAIAHQSGSNRTRRLPPMRLMPQPPALEDSRNINCPGSWLNCATILARFFSVVVPSSRSTGYCMCNAEAQSVTWALLDKGRLSLLPVWGHGGHTNSVVLENCHRAPCFR